MRWLEAQVITIVQESFGPFSLIGPNCEDHHEQEQHEVRAVKLKQVRDSSWVLPSNPSSSFERQMQGVEQDGGSILFSSPSHLLADAAEVWAHFGGIEVSDGCQRWDYSEGMLFGSSKK